MESDRDWQDDGVAAGENSEAVGEAIGGGSGNGNGGPSGAVADAGQPLAALTAERDDLKDRYLRLAAEFDNWKKRARKEQAEAESKAREGVLRDILEVSDNLERAVSAYGDGSNTAVDGPTILKGVGLVLRLFQAKLERHDVRPIVALGEPFDPRQHEAISRVETNKVPPGAVAAELQRGYRIGERLLRPALVSVAAAPTSPSSSSSDGAGGSA